MREKDIRMKNREKGAYVLGTDPSELHRLGFQHQVWVSEALQGWKQAQFSYGQTILDLGCGPGFATIELAYLVGPEGRVIAVDKSEQYLQHLAKLADQHGLKYIEIIHSTVEELELKDESIDCIYHRWVLAWMDGIDAIIEKMSSCLKSGGKIVSHEYFDWATLQLSPSIPEWDTIVKAVLKSFNAGGGNINIGRVLPTMLEERGLEVQSIRPMVKMARPDQLEWNWPNTFFKIYFPKVVEMGYMSSELCDRVLKKLDQAKAEGKTILMTPTMIEVIARKK